MCRGEQSGKEGQELRHTGQLATSLRWCLSLPHTPLLCRLFKMILNPDNAELSPMEEEAMNRAILQHMKEEGQHMPGREVLLPVPLEVLTSWSTPIFLKKAVPMLRDTRKRAEEWHYLKQKERQQQIRLEAAAAVAAEKAAAKAAAEALAAAHQEPEVKLQAALQDPLAALAAAEEQGAGSREL